ncbi:g5426 [Coccomyxa elongata]
MLPAERNYSGELCRVPRAKEFAGALHDKLQAAKRCLAAAQSRQKAWADSHRSAKEFKPDYWRRVRQGQVTVPADMQEGSANSGKRDIRARSQTATGRIPSKTGKRKGVTC